MIARRWLLSLVLLAACGGSDGPSGVYQVTIISGANQSAAVGSTIDPLVVKVTTTDGEAVSGKSVRWRASLGCGSVNVVISSTNDLGVTSTTPTLGQIVGAQQFEATV
jgi:hypothetical protein